MVTAACILSNRHPLALAEEAILLDELSGGRLDLGIARGGPWIDLDVFGTGLHRYHNGFAESVDLLLAWLSGTEKVGADGELFRFPPVAVVPAPGRPVGRVVAYRARVHGRVRHAGAGIGRTVGPAALPRSIPRTAVVALPSAGT